MKNQENIFSENKSSCFYELKVKPSNYREEQLKKIIQQDLQESEPKLLINGRKHVNLHKPTVLTTQITFN